MSQRGDVEASLTAMDGKLRELQHELSVLGAPVAPDPPAPPLADPGAHEPTAEGLQPEQSDLPPTAAAADQARAIVAGAQAEATRIVGDAAQRVTAITAQIDDLQRLRDDLERSARALVEDYSAALSGAGRPAREPAPRERPQRRSESPASPVHPPLW